MSSTPIYSLRVPDVYTALETSPEWPSHCRGRSPASAVRIQPALKPETTSVWSRLVSQFAQPVPLLLAAVGFLVLFRGDPVLGLVIFALVIANAGFSFWRGYRSEQAIEKLRQLLPWRMPVWRGTEKTCTFTLVSWFPAHPDFSCRATTYQQTPVSSRSTVCA